MRDYTLVVLRQGPILESCGKGSPQRRRLHCRNIDGRDRRCQRFDRDYALRMSVLADLQSDKNERCQHGTSADDLGQTRQLLDCHRRDNNCAPHTLYSRNSRAYASLSEGLTKLGSKALIRVRCSRDLTKPLQRTAIRLDSMTYIFCRISWARNFAERQGSRSVVSTKRG